MTPEEHRQKSLALIEQAEQHLEETGALLREARVELGLHAVAGRREAVAELRDSLQRAQQQGPLSCPHCRALVDRRSAGLPGKPDILAHGDGTPFCADGHGPVLA